MPLNERAIKVYFRRTRPPLTKRDTVAETFLQDEFNDRAYVVNKKLFRDTTNPVNRIVHQHDQIYLLHKRLTIPHVDAGPRLLASRLYMEYREEMRREMDKLDRLMAEVMPSYHACVDRDVLYRTHQDSIAFQSKPKPPNYKPPSHDEYPTAHEFQAATTCDLRFEALPDMPHWLLDEDKADNEARLAAVEKAATSHVIETMLDPLKKLADKLALPIGEKGSIFRDATIENVREAVEHARRIAIETTPELEAVCIEILNTMNTYEAKKEWLRESPINRQMAADKLKEIERQMSGLMGGQP